jgi:signal transduction histidine kinase
LGLFISKSIVEAHGGKIWAENNVSDGSNKESLKIDNETAEYDEGFTPKQNEKEAEHSQQAP